MEHNLQKLNSLKQLRLSDTERGAVRAHLVHYMQTHPKGSVPSLFHKGLHVGLRMALSSFMFFLLVGGTVSAVADSALPVDPLYAFKLNVNEEVKGLFQKTPEEKVAYNAKRVETRVNEIKTLSETKTLTKAKQATVQKALDEHIEALSADLSTLSDTAPSAALAATATLEDTLKANKETLANPDAAAALDSTLAKVSTQEVKILSKEVDAIASDVSATNAAYLSTSAATTTATSASASATLSTPQTNTPVGP